MSERNERWELEAQVKIAKCTCEMAEQFKILNGNVQHVAGELAQLNALLKLFFFPTAKGFEITQIGEDGMPTNNSITLGQVGNFTSVTSPAGSSLQAGTTPAWTSSDPLTTLTPSPDGFSVAVGTSATDTATSFTLTETGTNSAGAVISTSVTVALVAPAVPASGFVITQTS